MEYGTLVWKSRPAYSEDRDSKIFNQIKDLGKF